MGIAVRVGTTLVNTVDFVNENVNNPTIFHFVALTCSLEKTICISLAPCIKAGLLVRLAGIEQARWSRLQGLDSFSFISSSTHSATSR